MYKILLVDDDENILLGYRRNLRTKFNFFSANGAAAALKELEENKDFAVVISDYSMPGMNGIEFLSRVKEIQPDAVRMLLTGNAELSMAIDSVNEGNIFRFLTKPCTHETLLNIINQGVEQYRLVIAEKELLEKTLKGSLKILIDILAIANPAVFNRSVLIRDFAKKMLKRLEIQSSWEIEIACLLSQIGCVGIPSTIVEKKLKGELLSKTEEEMYLSQTDISESLLKNIPRLEKIADAISQQYKPLSAIHLSKESLTDKNIILIPRLLRLLNDYFLLTEKGNDNAKALKYIQEEKEQYDPLLLGVLEAELEGMQQGYIIESVGLDDLSDGMILAADLYDKNHFKILSKGIIFSDIYIVKLKNYAKVTGITEQIKVQVKAK